MFLLCNTQYAILFEGRDEFIRTDTFCGYDFSYCFNLVALWVVFFSILLNKFPYTVLKDPLSLVGNVGYLLQTLSKK